MLAFPVLCPHYRESFQVIWHFYDGRAAMELRIGELREDYALRKIPTRSFEANALYLEIIRLAHNLVAAFQRQCLQESWQNLTLAKLRYKLFLLPGELAPRIAPYCGLANLHFYETSPPTYSRKSGG